MWHGKNYVLLGKCMDTPSVGSWCKHDFMIQKLLGGKFSKNFYVFYPPGLFPYYKWLALSAELIKTKHYIKHKCCVYFSLIYNQLRKKAIQLQKKMSRCKRFEFDQTWKIKSYKWICFYNLN